MHKRELSLLNKGYKENVKAEYNQQIKVLLLNSSKAELEFLRNEIEKDKNIKVIAMAKSAHEAMNMTRLYDLDIILTDILDPQSGGVEFLKRINQFYPRPVLVISSLRRMPFHLALSAFKMGVADVIDKDSLFNFERIPYGFLLSKIKVFATKFLRSQTSSKVL